MPHQKTEILGWKVEVYPRSTEGSHLKSSHLLFSQSTLDWWRLVLKLRKEQPSFICRLFCQKFLMSYMTLHLFLGLGQKINFLEGTSTLSWDLTLLFFPCISGRKLWSFSCWVSTTWCWTVSASIKIKITMSQKALCFLQVCIFAWSWGEKGRAEINLAKALKFWELRLLCLTYAHYIWLGSFHYRALVKV